MVRYYDPETTSEEDARPRERTRSPALRQALMRERNAALEGKAAFDAAKEVALRQLDVRARSQHELESAIAFARAFARGRFEAGGKTGSALKMDLSRKGLSSQIIAQVLSEIDADEEYSRAHALAEKKMRSLTMHDRQVIRRRLFSMLARKGYAPQVCIRVIDELLESEDCDEL